MSGGWDFDAFHPRLCHRRALLLERRAGQVQRNNWRVRAYAEQLGYMTQGENLERLWYRKALWILLAHENPVEVECRAKETQHGPYESKIEDDASQASSKT